LESTDPPIYRSVNGLRTATERNSENDPRRNSAAQDKDKKKSGRAFVYRPAIVTGLKRRS